MCAQTVNIDGGNPAFWKVVLVSHCSVYGHILENRNLYTRQSHCTVQITDVSVSGYQIELGQIT